jgi:DNA-binding MarR family transcriptional regulator
MTIEEAAKRSARKAQRPAPRRREVYRLGESPSHLLRRIEQFASEVFLKAALPGEITLRQTVLLAAIAEAEGASQSDLVSATGVDRSTLAEMMARMERKGLIDRSAAEDDGRAKSVSLTNEGRRRLEAALPAMRAVDKALLAALSMQRRTSFVLALTDLAEAVDHQHAAADETLRVAKRDERARKPTNKKGKKHGKQSTKR